MEKSKPIFKRTRTTKEQAEIQRKKTFNCQHCSKSYLSYPALYTHSKNKHEGLPISSKNADDVSGTVPVEKLKSILNETKSATKEQLERKLLVIAKNAQIQLYQTLKRHTPLQLEDITVHNLSDTTKIVEKGQDIAKQRGIPQQVCLPGLTAEIFRQQHTRIAKISLGGDMLKFFCKTVEGPRVYVQIMLLEYGKDIQDEELKLWDSRLDLTSLHQYWDDWKQTATRLHALQKPLISTSKQVENNEEQAQKREVLKQEQQANKEYDQL